MRVVVTRPEPGLSGTMERLRRGGYEPVALPLSRITALRDGVVEAGRRRCSGYVVTSAAALDATHGRLDPALPIWTVGPATAEAARLEGFQTVMEGPGDGRGLAAALVAQGQSAGKLLYLAGRVRTPVLEQAMRAGGLPLDVIEVYDTQPISYHEDVLAERLAGDPVVLLYSAGAARRFRALEIAGFAGSFVCISDNVAAELGARGAGLVTIAEAADEGAMLLALDRARNQAGPMPFTV